MYNYRVHPYSRSNASSSSSSVISGNQWVGDGTSTAGLGIPNPVSGLFDDPALEALQSRSLQVSGLPPDISEVDVVASVPPPYNTEIKNVLINADKSSAIIDFYDLRHAEKARKAMKDATIKSVQISVQYAPAKPRSDDKKDLNMGTLYVRPQGADRSFMDPNSIEAYKTLFGQYGELKKVSPNRKREAEKFIEFFDSRGSQKAQELLNGFNFNGVILEVQYAQQASRTLNRDSRISDLVRCPLRKNEVSTSSNSYGPYRTHTQNPYQPTSSSSTAAAAAVAAAIAAANASGGSATANTASIKQWMLQQQQQQQSGLYPSYAAWGNQTGTDWHSQMQYQQQYMQQQQLLQHMHHQQLMRAYHTHNTTNAIPVNSVHAQYYQNPNTTPVSSTSGYSRVASSTSACTVSAAAAATSSYNTYRASHSSSSESTKFSANNSGASSSSNSSSSSCSISSASDSSNSSNDTAVDSAAAVSQGSLLENSTVNVNSACSSSGSANGSGSSDSDTVTGSDTSADDASNGCGSDGLSSSSGGSGEISFSSSNDSSGSDNNNQHADSSCGGSDTVAVDADV